ncbi:DUF1852 domain-containing protein [Brevundimonas intermedia]|uniref:DUF1852 domain-containing protein n=1 Tax=Brevundimonas intermedia TaxID=74315 RepID=A0A4Y9RYM1_9CAUL|nr:DUF1852 domain-containing protein [Brevundimonas intermedia]TFW12845.1 DUF1852 domain-containing protein [Brevundimonas intermedia]
MVSSDFTFRIKRTALDEDYRPAENTRITTNFANLARGESRQENLRSTLRMMDNRFNSLAWRDNPRGDRYALELQIVSVEMSFSGTENTDAFPLIEILQTTIVDQQTGARIDGIVGNNFSSYVRDYDFSVVLPEHMKAHPNAGAPDDFGDLHGKLFRHFLGSRAYQDNFAKPPVICLSVSSNKTYHRTGAEHPVLGLEYANEEFSPTDRYFAKMGMKVRYFMPKGSVAPFAFYHIGDLTGDYTDLELVSTIATMETFQKIYRPEIYNANSPATEQYQPSLKAQDYSLTRIVYDREERSRLAVEQGRFVEERFIKPYRAVLDQWSANFAAA